MLTEKPTRCPLCDGYWKSIHDRHFVCDSYKVCGLIFIDTGSDFYLHKVLSDSTDVYWCSNKLCRIRLPNQGFTELSFDPPYSLTPERLKILILFS